jgi:hypothetical protein
MALSTMITSNEARFSDLAQEQAVRQVAVGEGLRLQKSRRLNDCTFGPTLYWLFDSKTQRLITSKSGWSLEDVEHYLSA